jgi:hypothetical protein
MPDKNSVGMVRSEESRDCSLPLRSRLRKERGMAETN